MHMTQIIHVSEHTHEISCDGTNGGKLPLAMGHPTVYYTFDGGRDTITCEYCGCLFTTKKQKQKIKRA
jgi:uncharacterized Zn-finger protein